MKVNVLLLGRLLPAGGKKCYDRQMKRLAAAGVEVLLSVWHTPPSISEGNACNSPPRRLQDYADFIDLLLTGYGHQCPLTGPGSAGGKRSSAA